MKIAVEFPSIVYRDGPEARRPPGQGHRGHRLRPARRVRSRRDGPSHRRAGSRSVSAQDADPRGLDDARLLAAVTRRIGLGTEVLVLPQRHPTLVAKQISTLDTLSGGRVRLGVGVGWQESEYDAQGVDFHERGARMDEAIALLRRYWSEDPVDAPGPFYPMKAIAMEPKPPQGGRCRSGSAALGAGRAAPRRPARRRMARSARRRRSRAGPSRRRHRQAPRRGGGSRSGGARLPIAGSAAAAQRRRRGEAILGRAAAGGRRRRQIREAGFDGVAVNATGMFQAGARSLDALIDALGAHHDAIRREVG